MSADFVPIVVDDVYAILPPSEDGFALTDSSEISTIFIAAAGQVKPVQCEKFTSFGLFMGNSMQGVLSAARCAKAAKQIIDSSESAKSDVCR
jgi:hypothetical protein